MGLANVLGYFTILTNLLVAAYLTINAVGLSERVSVGVKTALTSYILVVGAVYEVALRRLWNQEGLRFAVDVVLHYVMPLGYFTYWLAFVPKGTLRYRAVWLWTIYPLAYLVYSMIRGQLYGFFPYPFIAFTETGWPRFFVNVAVLIVVFVVTGLLLIALDRLFARRRLPYTEYAEQ
jgi:hypothetical protein